MTIRKAEVHTHTHARTDARTHARTHAQQMKKWRQQQALLLVPCTQVTYFLWSAFQGAPLPVVKVLGVVSEQDLPTVTRLHQGSVGSGPGRPPRLSHSS